MKLNRSVEIAGITILIAFFSSVLLLANSPFHSGQRGAAFGALGAAALLEFLWVLTAAILAVLRWSATSTRFRVIFLVNIIIVLLLAPDFFH